MIAPEHLQHKPIIAVDDYDRIDGQYAPNTDAQALSIGIAQYDGNEFSAKVFRHTGSTWSRQSEELPIHRALDLAILIVSSMNPDNSDGLPSNLNERVIDVDKYDQLLAYYNANRAVFQPRLTELRRLLNNLP